VAGTVVRELVARVGINVDPTGANKAQDMFATLAKGAQLAVAAIAASKFVNFLESVVNEADKLNDAAERIGTTTQALQGLGYAAGLAGSDSETLNQGLKFLTKTIAEASGGSKTAQKAFTDLGVSYKNADGSLKRSDQLFGDIADALKKVEDPTKRAALSMGVFSRAGQELAPFLAKGSDGINAMRAEFEALGGSFSAEFVQQSAEVNDNFDRLGAIFKGVGASIAGGLLPSINRLIAKFTDWWKLYGRFIRDRLENAFKAIATVIEKIIQLFDPWIDVTMAITSLIDDIVDAMGGWAPVILTIAGLAALIWAPWILIAAAIALVAEDLYTFATGGESVIGDLVDSLFSFLTEGDTVFHAFAAMFLSLITTLRDGGFGALWNEFTEIIQTAVKFWAEVFQGFVSFALDTVKGLVSAIWESITGAFAGALGKIKSTFGFAVDANTTSLGDLSNPNAITGLTAPSSSVTNAPIVAASNTTQVTVNASPGMDESALADAVAEKVAERQQAERDALYNAAIPALR
jgi:hypothetical protein